MALEQVYKCPRTLRRLRNCFLGKFAEGFCCWLLEYGFSGSAIRQHFFRLSHLNEHLGSPECGIRQSISTRDVKASFEAYSLQCQKTGAREKHVRLAQLRQLEGYFCANSLKLHTPSKKVGTTNYVLKISEEDSI